MGDLQGPLCHDFGIRGYGNPDYGVVVVGIAPGRDEAEKTKKPFTGPSGQLLNDLLKFAGWDRSKVYTTNTICWWNNAPNTHQIEECGTRFRHEVLALKPKLIVTAGAIVNETVMGAKRRKGSRGSIVWSPYWESYILDTHHPSFALHSQSLDAVQDIIRDLYKIKLVQDWPRDGSIADVTYEVVSSLGEAQRVLEALPRNQQVTLDIETSNPDNENIDAYSDQLVSFSLSYYTGGYTPEWPGDGRHIHSVVFPGTLFPQCVRDGTHVRSWLRDGACGACLGPFHIVEWPLDVAWTFQFGQYDIPALYIYFGQRLPLRGDTGLMSACADERPGHHGLKLNAREFCGSGWYEELVKPFYKGRMHLLDMNVEQHYNAQDSNYTLRLASIHTQRMRDDETEVVYKDVLLPAMETFIDMQIRGIAVDQKVLQELAYDNWFPRYLQMFEALQEEAHDIGWATDDINIGSHKQMTKLFFTILGVEPTKFSKKTGAPSLDKEVLDAMDHPFATKIRAFRTLDTMIDYVLAVYANMKYDGLLHPSAFVTTTRTGRTSYRDPAMQTLPKDYTVGADYARLREIITAHDTNTHEIIEADYNQIEVWLAWAFSRDEVLHQHLLSGDVHSATAEIVFKTKRELWTPAEWNVKRQGGKKTRFGIQYGEGAEKLASPPPLGIGGTVAEARAIITEYKRGYPQYTKWMSDIQRQALNEGYLRAPDGGVMRFPVVMDHKQLRQAINFPIQRTASMYNLKAMTVLAPLLRQYNSHIILNIHDALAVESDKRYRTEVMALIREVMEREWFTGFPSIKVEMKVGPSLGKVQKV